MQEVEIGCEGDWTIEVKVQDDCQYIHKDGISIKNNSKVAWSGGRSSRA